MGRLIGRMTGTTLAAIGILAMTTALWFGTMACDSGEDSDMALEYDEGATDNEQTTGRQERGRDPGHAESSVEWTHEGGQVWSYELHYSDLILSPDGENLFSMVPKPGPEKGFEEPGLVLTVQPLPTGERKVFPQMQDLQRINFSPEGHEAYLLRNGGREIAVMELDNYTYKKAYYLDYPFSVIDVTPDGAYLILSNLPVTDTAENSFIANSEDCTPDPSFGMPAGASLCQAAVVDLTSDQVWDVSLPHRARDIDFDPINGELLFTYSKQYSDGLQIKSHVLFYQPEINDFSTKLMFENCADEVVMSPDLQLALLSPNDCMIFQVVQDPISVIDLGTREFVTNLPGFGPVSISPDGSTAVGFTRREVMQSQWSYFDQAQPVGLIFVDLDTLDWQVVDWGANIPAYTISPDGKFLYVYEPDHARRLTRIDMKTRTTFELAGPDVDLDQFVWTDAGDKMYLISDSHLYFASNHSNELKSIGLDISPELINMRPQGDYLVMGEGDRPTFYTASVDELTSFYPTQEQFELGLDDALATDQPTR